MIAFYKSFAQAYLPERSHVLLQDSLAGDLNLRINSHSFLKNNEYYSPLTQGFTGIGVYFQPKVAYQIDANTSLHLGYHFLHFSGLKQISEAIPLFRIEHQFSSSVSLVMGQIYSGLHHDLEEPHYRIDRDYQNNVEYGLQLLYDQDWIHVDSWIHWAQFIQRNDPFPESIYAGQNYDVKLWQGHRFGLYANAEVLISHQGGQIDRPSEIDRTLMNGAIGITPRWQLSKHRIIAIQYQYYLSQVNKQVPDMKSALYYPFESGKGMLWRGRYDAQYLSASVAYWKASTFISSIGESLFVSVSDFDQTFQQPVRSVLHGRLSYDRSLSPNLCGLLQANGYVDVDSSHIDFSLQLSLRMSFDLLLKSYQ